MIAICSRGESAFAFAIRTSISSIATPPSPPSGGLFCVLRQKAAGQVVQARQRIHERRAVFVVEGAVIRRVGEQGGDFLRLVAAGERRQQRLDRVCQQNRGRPYPFAAATIAPRAGRWRTCADAG